MVKFIFRRIVAGAVAAALCISFVFAIEYEDGVLPESVLSSIMNTENYSYASFTNNSGSTDYENGIYFVGALSAAYEYQYIYGRQGNVIPMSVESGNKFTVYLPLFIDNSDTTLTLDLAYYIDFEFWFNVDVSKLVFAEDGSSVRTPVEITNERNVTYLAANAGNSYAPNTTTNTQNTMSGGGNYTSGKNNAFTVTVSGDVDVLVLDFTFNGNYSSGMSIYGTWAVALLSGVATVPPPKTINDVIAELHIIQDKLDAIIEELQDQQAGMSGTIQQIVQNQQIIIEDTAEDEAQFALIQQQQQAVEDRIDELEEKMELVQPVDPDDLHLSGDQVLSTDYDVQSFSDVFGSFLENQFILQMMMTVLGLGLLSYIFFGKKT